MTKSELIALAERRPVETDPVKIAAARARLNAEAPALSKAAWEFVRNGRRS